LKAISKEMKKNIDALNEQLPHAGLTQTSLAEALPNETIVTVPIDVSKEIMDKEAPKEIMDKTTLKEFVNEPSKATIGEILNAVPPSKVLSKEGTPKEFVNEPQKATIGEILNAVPQNKAPLKEGTVKEST